MKSNDNRAHFLEELIERLQAIEEEGEKIQLLEQVESVASQLLIPHYHALYTSLRENSHRRMFLTLVALDAGYLFFNPSQGTKSIEEIEALLSHFFEIEHYYRQIGGLVGYVYKVQQLLVHPEGISNAEYHHPDYISIEGESVLVKHASTFGLAHLDRVAFMVAAGGLGTRLSLVNEQGEALPVAHLLFMGRPLLEGLIRDLEGLEELYYETYGTRIVIPLAIMTSKEHHNDQHIRALFEKHNYFGRPLASIHIFSQLSVPVLTVEGHFSATGPAEFLFHPAGHGAIWKSAEEAGLFGWLESQRIEHLILRQINNPLAGLDHNFLAFLGLAVKQQKGFGFLACERLAGAAEGALIDRVQGDEHCIVNIEYTQLKHKNESKGVANTNILYVRLSELREKLKQPRLFSPIVNMKNEVPYYAPNGKVEKIRGGRLESMMQAISESFTAPKGKTLPTLVVKGSRLKTISAIKRSYDPKGGALESAEAAHYALLYNSYLLLKRCTSKELAAFSSLEHYMQQGATYLFSYHPRLGPLYEVIEKKWHCQSVVKGSEIELEAAQLSCKEMEIQGSLRIHALEGKVTLLAVRIENRGINWEEKRDWWRGSYLRHESCLIEVEEGGELIAEKITLSGNQLIRVAAGHRVTITQESSGALSVEDIAVTELLYSKKKADR